MLKLKTTETLSIVNFVNHRHFRCIRITSANVQ